MAKIKGEYEREIERIKDEKVFLEDSIAQLNDLIEKDRKTIAGLKEELETLKERQAEEVLYLRS